MNIEQTDPECVVYKMCIFGALEQLALSDIIAGL